MNYWLLKTEPGAYSYDDLVRDGRTVWDGVRNYQARNHLAAMEVGDFALIYHSGAAREVVGVARVVRTAYPDPTTDDPQWVAVEVEPFAALPEAVTLEAIKTAPAFRETPLLRQTRLSVVPLTEAQFRHILALGRAEGLVPSAS